MPRHDLDIVSLVAGLAVGGAALVFLVDQETGITGRWVWPILLIAIGIAGLLGTSRRQEPQPAPTPSPPSDSSESPVTDHG